MLAEKKIVFEKHIEKLNSMGIDLLSPNSTYGEFKDVTRKVWESSTTLSHMIEVLDLHKDNNFKHYVFADSFYDALKRSVGNFKSENIPAKLCFNESEPTYQVSLPDETYDFVIHFRGDKNNEFNIAIYYFNYEGTDSDFRFWVLKGDSQTTCGEMLEEFMQTADTSEVGNIGVDKIKDQIKNMFDLLINIMLYINSGEPDIRHLKATPRGKIDFTGKKRNQKLRKYKSKTFYNYTIVGFSFKKETLVNGFFRWQPHGPMNSLRRFQWIDGFPRKSKGV